MSLILYLLQVTCCLAFFYAFYHYILRKETLFETNRLYLVATLAASIVLPLIKIYIESRPADTVSLIAPAVYVGAYVDALATDKVVADKGPFPWDRMITGIYLLGIAMMAVRLVHAVRDIQWIRKHGTAHVVEGHTCIFSDKVKSPFSFFNSIYFPGQHQFAESELKEIVAHELAHVKGRHTLDVLFMETACIFLWPSPLIYFYRKALKDVHEYVADAAVIRDTPWEEYAQLLVGQQQGQLQNILSNQLIYSQLKKRLLMMNQERSGFAARFKYLGIIPVVLLALVLFSFREKQTDAKHVNSVMNAENLNEEVILYVTNSQRYFLGSKEITRDKLNSELAELMRGKDDRVLKLLLDQSVTVSELSEVLDVAYKLQINVTLDTAEVYDLYKSGLKTNMSFSSNSASGVSGNHTPSVFQAPLGKPDTLPDTYVVAMRNTVPKGGIDINSFPGGTSTEELKKYGYERQLPIFPGCELVPFANQGQCGMEKLGEYINANMVYPESVREEGIEGRVVVKFVVGADGYIKNQISITESLHPDADLVVLRLIQDMNVKVGKWMPARKEGKSMDAEMHLPIKFALSENQTKVEPLKQVDEMARFPGCEHLTNVEERNICAQQEMFKFVYTNINYPKEDRDNNIEGTGVIQFVINTDGRLSDIEILRSPSDRIKAELERLMKVMSDLPDRWIPARKDGKPVPYQLILPVKFKLQDEQQNATKSNDASLEANTPTVKVVPNPAQDYITVSIFKDTHTLKIFDTAGKLMITQKVTSSSATNETINISTLKPGQYVVQVISDKEAISAAFAVVK